MKNLFIKLAKFKCFLIAKIFGYARFAYDENGDQMAIEYKNYGDRVYYLKNNIYHRTDGPAITKENNFKYWLVEGELHRIDGPAAIGNKKRLWYIRNVDFSEEIENWLKENNIKYPFSKEDLLLFQITWC